MPTQAVRLPVMVTGRLVLEVTSGETEHRIDLGVVQLTAGDVDISALVRERGLL